MRLYSIICICLIFIFTSCKKDGVGDFLSTPDRKPYFEPVPFGMAKVEQGSFSMGPSDQDIERSATPVKKVSVESFWIDETEITNNEYRQFVSWVRDSIARSLLAESFPEFIITETRKGELLENPRLNWETKINWKEDEYRTVLNELLYQEQDRFFGKEEIDTRKLIYEYFWIDYKQAAKRANSYNYQTQSYSGMVTNQQGEQVPIQNRSSFIMGESTAVYPDTLVWIRDFTYSYNEPFSRNYFWHIAYDDYPVVGVTWQQAKAFCHWRTRMLNEFQDFIGEPGIHDYRLPNEAEWEYAARGGKQMTIYPWGSYYTRTQDGCFVANFKPLRGNYVADSNVSTNTMKVGSYDPNPFGIYDMAGNVAEWTSGAFDESSYDYMNDLNPTYEYNARHDDPAVLKRKVIRGGSWKDIAHFIQVSSRSFEYQDTAKSYVGFRCVRTSFKGEYDRK
ncbi:MAG: gliding motility-associated lipoprotein [Bacteroidetes bacterium GWF2_42_66]|nr:MAG: gliding motility-associated lipoprotein [Bacteroidetes bacterium GWA2_42_15]OFX98381.1 MAG: gliding motility-associated lipoprotein [Bacteroidetes bacterium GWE2_42_39]OFY42766.1 MAG: gliding motility-associated lipoprotein [Bacteroidetes bacterium GWF2_42_66]HBL74380.1 gliding motility-associated lipoprotein [Prolixibacteraceae bacterium]HCR91856.1 gliding motility-associated lipoprotein [Prolixibacteraceae bacterium]